MFHTSFILRKWERCCKTLSPSKQSRPPHKTFHTLKKKKSTNHPQTLLGSNKPKEPADGLYSPLGPLDWSTDEESGGLLTTSHLCQVPPMLKTREDPYNSANSEVAQEEGEQVSFQHIQCGRQYTQQFPHNNTPVRWALFTSLQLSPLENRIPILQRSKESQGC